ncbi:Whole genome shotgun sequence [Vibrio owensii]|uniref:Whole genome shotgun sequence n=1 Tax=Vibrio owensii TaxID=696485 RepID=A0AAU9PZP1_9VIBR|nr:Whole genome shotgun sequence [Vibrio owensii]
MRTNLVCKSKVERRYNAKVVGSNKLTYVPYTPSLAANEENYSDGQLRQSEILHINYDVTGAFPEKQFAQALTPTTTELAQAHAKPIEFSYKRQPTHVEFSISNLQDVSDVNINAGILNRMLMQYDYEMFNGKYGNAGMFNSANSVEVDDQVFAISTIADVFIVIEALHAEMSILGITESDYPRITLSYSSDVAALLRKPISVSSGAMTTGRSEIAAAYPNMTQKEVPNVLGAGSHLSLAWRSGITNHHASLPGIYSKQEGDHGLSMKTLFTYESAANQIEEKAGYVYQKTSTPNSRALAEQAAKAAAKK